LERENMRVKYTLERTLKKFPPIIEDNKLENQSFHRKSCFPQKHKEELPDGLTNIEVLSPEPKASKNFQHFYWFFKRKRKFLHMKNLLKKTMSFSPRQMSIFFSK